MKYLAYPCSGLVAVWIACILIRPIDGGGESNLIRVSYDGTKSNANLPAQNLENNSNETNSLPAALNDEERQRIIEREEEWFQAFRANILENGESSAKPHKPSTRLHDRKTERELKLLPRKEWIDNFPYKMEFHPTIFYSEKALEWPDLEMFEPQLADLFADARNNSAELLAESGDAAEEFKAALLKIKREYEAARFPAMKAHSMVENHFLLKFFYHSELRYTDEFQLVYQIINEYGYADNTMMVVAVFDGLMHHYHALSHNPDEIYFHGMTWGEWTKNTEKFILAALYRMENSFLHGERRPSKAEAEEMSFRIKSAIPRENISEKDFRLSVNLEHRNRKLKEGDPLIYK